MWRAIPLALLRIYVGLFWFTYGRSKFEPDWAGGKLEFLDAVKYAAAHTTAPFNGLLTSYAIPHQAVFAELIAYGETLVGIALVLGLATKAGAAGSMFLSLNYFLAQGLYKLYFGVESLEALVFVIGFFLLLEPSQQFFSLDSLLLKAWQRRRGASS